MGKVLTRRARACTARIARRRVHAHPLDGELLVETVLEAWEELLSAQTSSGVNLVRELGIAPRAIGDLLEKLIVRRLAAMAPGVWRGDDSSHDKDAVYLIDDRYSFEIKTSSGSELSGNRCYATPGRSSVKSKSGYYLVVNYENPRKTTDPRVRRVRFGWLDQEDWRPQQTGTGQQARISSCDA